MCCLLALAPEIDLKYETIYAYLNNDITRKLPTRDLALRLFSEDAAERISLRHNLLHSATLFRTGLLRSVSATPDQPTWLARSFFLAPFVSQYLLDLDQFTSSSESGCALPVNPVARCSGVGLSAPDSKPNCEPVPAARRQWPGAGFDSRGPRRKWETFGRRSNLLQSWHPAYAFRSGRSAPGSGTLSRQFEMTLWRQRLHHAAIYLEHGEALIDKEGHPVPEAFEILNRLAPMTSPVFLECSPDTPCHGVLRDQRCLRFSFGDLDYEDRRDLWHTYVARSGSALSQPIAETSAVVLCLRPAKSEMRSRQPRTPLRLEGKEERSLSFDGLFNAARAQSDHSLGKLALKVNTIYTWDDLVLPQTTFREVRR